VMTKRMKLSALGYASGGTPNFERNSSMLIVSTHRSILMCQRSSEIVVF
jgi:hypothetical protein